jgi:hypothetical protein
MRGFPAPLVLAGVILPAAPVLAAGEAYTYVKFSLDVPWSMYFFFLLLILIPFGVMILLAWRQATRRQEKSKGE